MSDALRSIHPELAPRFAEALTNGIPTSDIDGASAFLARPLLEDATALGATDIHIEPHREGSRVRFRIDGTVRDIYHLSTAAAKVLVNQIKAHSNLDPVVRFTPTETRAQFDSAKERVDLRVSVAPALDREIVAIRLLYSHRLERSISELGLTQEHLQLLDDWMAEINGMFVAAGPTGSGKTTTLYAILHSLKRANRIIVSLEDPVEYRVDGIAQIQIDELHDFQFSDGIKAVLRHDPDYLVVGEIRDPASAQTAVSAAVAGRVLLTTMHSRDCVGAVTALRNWHLQDHEIAESVSVVLSQRLVRKRCIHCGERRSPTPREAAWFRALSLECPEHLWESKGCEKCHGLGVRGRTGLFELWRLDDSDYQLILNHADERRLRAWLAEKGHRFLLSEALALLEQGVITFEEVRRATAGTVNTPLSPSMLPAPSSG